MRFFLFLFLFLSPGLLFSHEVVVTNNTLNTLSIISFKYVDFIEQKGDEYTCGTQSSLTLSFDSSELFSLLYFKNKKFTSRIYIALDNSRVPVHIVVEQSLMGLHLKVSNDPYVSGWSLFQNAITSYKNRLSEKTILNDNEMTELSSFIDQYRNFFPENSLYEQFTKIELLLLTDRVKGISILESEINLLLKNQLSDYYKIMLHTPIIADWIYQFVVSYMLYEKNTPNQKLNSVCRKCSVILKSKLETMGIYKIHLEKLLQAVDESTGYQINIK